MNSLIVVVLIVEYTVMMVKHDRQKYCCLEIDIEEAPLKKEVEQVRESLNDVCYFTFIDVNFVLIN